MNRRSLAAPLLAALLAIFVGGCRPDPVTPGGASSPSAHPTDHAAPSETDSANDGYDY
jgi:hypothetical protein